MMTFDQYLSQGEVLIAELKTCGKEIYLYGAGSIGNYTLGVLRKYGIEPAAYFTTHKSVNQICTLADTFNGLPVMPVTSIVKIPYNRIKMILTLDARHFDSVLPLLTKQGVTDILPLTVELQNSLLSVYYRDFFASQGIALNDNFIKLKDNIVIRNPVKLNSDDLKSVLVELNDLLLCDVYREFELLSEGPYLYENVKINNGDVVFDCGANIGIFSGIAAGYGASGVYSFEPDTGLCHHLSVYNTVYQDVIHPQRFALSDKSGAVTFYSSSRGNVYGTIVNPASNVNDENRHATARAEQIPSITIDDFVCLNSIARVDFIKADIEGAERLMLRGATETLRRFAPKLAICTYHLADDPQVIEDIIISANPNYKITHKWKKLYAYV
jgi:FkbM family methyltransferase